MTAGGRIADGNMISTPLIELSDGALNVLRRMQRQGVRLWVDDGRLHYRGLSGALPDEEIECLKEHKAQLIALLNTTIPDSPEHSITDVKAGVTSAPLAFTQLQHWNLYNLGELKAHRFVASATRIKGKLDTDVLRIALQEMVRRHDALRTRIVVENAVPVQQVTRTLLWNLEPEDLTPIPESQQELEVKQRIESMMLEPVDIALDPLISVRLLRLGPTENVLIVATEHIISDMASLGILLRELFFAYAQLARRQTLNLPDIPVQFADYAAWQRRLETKWVTDHGQHWINRLSGCIRLRFPADPQAPQQPRHGWSIVPVRIDRQLKGRLIEWCRRRGTTLVFAIFTAYVAAVLRWCNSSDGVIQYMSNSRVDPNLENTIGFFAAPLHLRLQIHDNDRWVDLLKRVTQEYCDAYEHSDHSYLEAQLPRPDYTRTTAFNWIPEGPRNGFVELNGPDDGLHYSPMLFDLPILKILERDSEPFMVMYDTSEETAGSLFYPLNRFAPETLKRLGCNLIELLEHLIHHPEQRISNVQLTSP